MGRRRAEFRSGYRGCFDIGVREYSKRQVSAVANPHGFRVSEHAGHACARKGDRSQIVISILDFGFWILDFGFWILGGRC